MTCEMIQLAVWRWSTVVVYVAGVHLVAFTYSEELIQRIKQKPCGAQGFWSSTLLSHITGTSVASGALVVGQTYLHGTDSAAGCIFSVGKPYWQSNSDYCAVFCKIGIKVKFRF